MSFTLMDDTANNNLKKLLMVAAVILFMAIIPFWPYGFYTLLRLVVCAIAGYSAFKIGHNENLKKHKVPLILIAILFNPLFPVYFVRLIWFPIDICIGIYLLTLRNRI